MLAHDPGVPSRRLRTVDVRVHDSPTAHGSYASTPRLQPGNQFRKGPRSHLLFEGIHLGFHEAANRAQEILDLGRDGEIHDTQGRLSLPRRGYHAGLFFASINVVATHRPASYT